MTGRDPHQDGRVATGLELFYDLVFVVGFSVATTLAGHQFAEAHYAAAFIGFFLCTFSAIWAWINFAWFASAFDTDDWVFRLVTLIQMVGVAIIAVGMPAVFDSVAHGGGDIDNRVLVLGYIVMRVGMVIQWLRAAAQSERHRRACLIYAAATVIAQLWWVLVLLSELSLPWTVAGMLIGVLIEMTGPVIAENRTDGTPWHAHHIAERYMLLTIVTLGEGVVGVVTLLGAQVAQFGWTLDTAVLGFTTMTATFAMWWIYSAVPSGTVLHIRRDKAFPWGDTDTSSCSCRPSGGWAWVSTCPRCISNITRWSATRWSSPRSSRPLAVYCLGVVVLAAHLLGANAATMIQSVAVVGVLAAAMILCAAGGDVGDHRDRGRHARAGGHGRRRRDDRCRQTRPALSTLR